MAPEETKAECEAIQVALVESIGERGYSDTQLEDVLGGAGIDAGEFELHYPSLDACFAELWRGYVQEFFERAMAAYLAEGSWRDGMRAQAWELSRFLSEDHLRARILVVEVNFGGELVQATRDRFMDEYVALIQLGGLEGEKPDEIPRPQAEAIFGAVWERVAAPVNGGDFDQVIESVPQILYLLFLPYLGRTVAEEELRRGSEDVARFRRGEL